MICEQEIFILFYQCKSKFEVEIFLINKLCGGLHLTGLYISQNIRTCTTQENEKQEFLHHL